MSLNFKTNLKEMRENDPASEDALNGDYKASENYDTPGNVRNLCFVWPDGRMKFMNYAYLISGEYLANDDLINLVFTTEKIIIKGLGLGLLFKQLFSHSQKNIVVLQQRYNAFGNNAISIMEIVIEPNK